jgi:hypothetical protein
MLNSGAVDRILWMGVLCLVTWWVAWPVYFYNKCEVWNKQFVGAVCHVANQELPFRGHNESSTSIDKENFTEFLNVLKNYDPILKKII